MKHNLPLTYEPKIKAVLSGKCTQTIRTSRRIQPGDEISFHGWQGKPYRSKWSFRTPYWKVTSTRDIILFPNGIAYPGKRLFRWNELATLAKLDGINPPTGEQLETVMKSMHKIPEDGLLARIIRWERAPEEKRQKGGNKK